MNSIFSKKAIFAILAALAALFGLLGLRDESVLRDSFWSELFWLTTGTIVTTFVLEAILQRDVENSRRREDRFAFRIFAANLLSLLLDMVDGSSDLIEELTTSALTDGDKFPQVTRRACESIREGKFVRGELYGPRYLDIASQLRDLSQNYIRLFSSSRQEMVQTYRTLQGLARRWVYRDELADDFQKYTSSLEMSDPVRRRREEDTQGEIQAVGKLLSDTAEHISVLAERVRCHQGMPPAP